VKKSKWFCTIFIITCCIGILSCSTPKKSTGIDLDATAYLAESLSLDLGGHHLIGIVADDEHLYIAVTETGKSSILIFPFGKNESTSIDLNFLSTNQSVTMLTLNEEGGFLLLVSSWESDHFKSTIVEIDGDAALIREIGIEQLIAANEELHVVGIKSNQSDDICLLVHEGSMTAGYAASSFYIMNKDIQITNRFATGDYVLDFIFIDNDIFYTVFAEGTILLKQLTFDEQGMNVTTIPTTNLSNITGLGHDREGQLLIADMLGMTQVDMTTGKADRFINWLDCNIGIDGIHSFGQRTSDEYWVFRYIHNEFTPNHAELIMLTRITYRELPPREYATFAVGYADSRTLNAIALFNRTNEIYHITLQEYYTGIDPFDTASLLAAKMKFMLDIMGSTPPDIVNIQDLDFYELAQRGSFTSLNQLLNNNRITQSDYLAPAFSSYNISEEIYAVMTGFRLKTLVGHRSKLGSTQNWTAVEFMDLSSQYPEAKLTRGSELDHLLLLTGNNLNQFIDWDNKVCHFDNDDFIRVLEFIATSSGMEDIVDSRELNYIGLHEGFRHEHYLLHTDYITSLNDFYIHEVMFDGEPQYMGFPTEDTFGFLAVPQSAVAIPVNSPNKNAASAFIQFLLGDNFQSNGDLHDLGMIPIKHSAIELFGERLLVETPGMGRRIPHGFSHDDMFIRIDLERDAEYLAMFYGMINDVQQVIMINPHIMRIIEEEISSLVNEQKTAQTVAAIINNRVQVYINEQ
jgi:ABC-type glycerol-3-phosphate transport system substrate-binding protein